MARLPLTSTISAELNLGEKKLEITMIQGGRKTNQCELVNPLLINCISQENIKSGGPRCLASCRVLQKYHVQST